MSRVPFLPLLPVLGLAACFAPTELEEGTDEVPEAISSVLVLGGAGDMRITGDPAAVGAHLRWRMRWSDERPTVAQSVQAGAWTVEADCPLQPACSVDLDLVVPAGAAATLDTGSGDITVRGLDGAVDVSAGSGDVLLDDVGGAVHVDIGSGDLTGTGLVAPLTAEVGSGDIDLVFVAPADVDLSTGSGDVALDVPPGAYAVSVDSGSGDVSVSGIEDSPSGAFALVVETGSGDVTIHAE